ncbi:MULTISPECIES: GvpL/GvpF family gas vesicle protein [unclassified Streptomyces]|uniref:GvpL/GvpF family gas vesicle protein n=1 Tax=unclassified Streptomyces TaxID=2593676 RepID=UPI000DD54E86|nr:MULTISPECIES: GvpL/GvpF family gas vesicle protein [unclassified Streptomyces]QZZ26067.1 GvpL/GvpF family gas vesicle protein [Streptomyces sp. ST1015]
MTALRYVYAVCPPFETPLPADLTGVVGEPPARLAHGHLVAVVSRVPEDVFAEEPLRRRLEDLDWLTATARAHERVVDALTTVTTPLPLRLATVFRDDSGVRTMLEEGEARFRHVLERIAGRVEWGVKVYVDREAPQEVPSPASGRDYLRQRRRAALSDEESWHRAELFSEKLHSALSTHADAVRLRPPQNSALTPGDENSGQNVFNAAFLVRRELSERFVEIAEGVRDGDRGIRVELTGPWAAYSFASGEPDEEAGP